MKKILLFLLFIPFFSACEKQGQFTIENENIPLLKEILIDGKPFMEYTYTRARLLNEEKRKFHYTKHSYDERNLLTASEYYMDQAMFSSSSIVLQQALNRTEWVSPENTAKSLTKLYEYSSDGRLIKAVFDRNSSDDGEYTTYTFENDRIVKQTMYWHEKVSSFINYFYDERGNVLREEKYMLLEDGTQQLMTTTEYEYDNRNNPFLAFRRLMIPGKYTNPNNILKETYTLHFEVNDPSIQKVQVSTSTYEYDLRGYPVKVNGEAEYIYE